MRCQLWKPRIFTPPGTAPPECPYLYHAQDGGRTQDQDTKQQRGEDTVNEQGDAEKRSTTTTRPGLQHGGPRGAGPTEQRQSSGTEGNASATRQETAVEHKPRVANATGGEEQPDCDTIQACATHGEASEHIGIHTSSNAHPDCAEATVHKPHGVTVLDCEPACDTQKERRQEKGKLQ